MFSPFPPPAGEEGRVRGLSRRPPRLQQRNSALPPLQELPFGGVGRAFQRGGVGLRGVGAAAESSEQVGADGVIEVVVVEVEYVDRGQRGGGSFHFGQGHGSVEGDDGGGGDGAELVVQG